MNYVNGDLLKDR